MDEGRDELQKDREARLNLGNQPHTAFLKFNPAAANTRVIPVDIGIILFKRFAFYAAIRSKLLIVVHPAIFYPSRPWFCLRHVAAIAEKFKKAYEQIRNSSPDFERCIEHGHIFIEDIIA